jgi:uncharacterized protein YpmS
MPLKNRSFLLPLFLILTLALLACGLGSRLQEAPEQAQALVTAQAAARGSGEAVQTVAALAPVQGATAVAALQAVEAPELDQIKTKLSTLQPDQFGNYTVTLTEEEINQLLEASNLLNDSGSQVQLQNTRIAFKMGKIDLTARLVEPLGADIQLSLLPVVQDGNLSFQLQEGSFGPLPAPQFVLSRIESALNEALNTALNDVPTTVALTSVSVGDGYITIIGRQG